MDLFDLLDRETGRLVADFEDCLPVSDNDASWTPPAQAVLGRMATYMLVMEQVLQPALLALQFESFDSLDATHVRMRGVVADALLSMSGPRHVAQRSLKAAQQVLMHYRTRLHRDFYPALFRLLSRPESLLLSDDMLQWMDQHCRQRRSTMPAMRGTARGRRSVPPPDTTRIPTLHHAIARGRAVPPGHARGRPS